MNKAPIVSKPIPAPRESALVEDLRVRAAIAGDAAAIFQNLDPDLSKRCAIASACFAYAGGQVRNVMPDVDRLQEELKNVYEVNRGLEERIARLDGRKARKKETPEPGETPPTPAPEKQGETDITK